MHIEAAEPAHRAAYSAYFASCRAEGGKYYLQAGDDAAAWYEQLLEHAAGRALPAGWVPYQTWFLLEGETIAGAIRLRLADTPAILDAIGHIGFEVLPAWRGKGYGRILLQYVQALAPCPVGGNWIVACAPGNIASVRTIEACGGQLLGDMEQGDGARVRRYSLTSLGF